MADLELPMPLPNSPNFTKVEETLGKPEVSKRDVNNMVTEMAHAMLRVAREGNDQFLHQVAANMHMVGEAHSQGEYQGGSVCDECGMGDSPWPCWHWLQAAYTGIEWLAKRAGVQL